MYFAVRGWACQDPALAPFQRGRQRREQGANPLALGETTNHLRHLAGRDHHVDTSAARHIGGLQLGSHAAGAEAADTVTRQRAQGIIDGLYLFNELGVGIGARIGGKQPLLVGQQDQQIRIRQNGGPCGEVVVVPHLDLGGRHRVIFVDDRNNAVIKQGAHGIAGVEVALPIFQIGAGQQHLADMQTVEVEQILPYPNQLGLTNRRQHLLVGQGWRQWRVTQMFTTGGDSPLCDDHDPVAVTVQGRTLSDQLDHMGTIELGRPPCEHAGAQLDDYGSVFHGSIKAKKVRNIFIPTAMEPCKAINTGVRRWGKARMIAVGRGDG